MAETNIKRTIDFTSFDFEALRDELISYLQETESFRDASFVQSNIRTVLDAVSYIGALFGYYTNSAANEVFLPTAKRYKNLNKIAQLLNYDARGVESATVDVIGSLNAEYVFGKENEYIDIPAYSSYPSDLATAAGSNFVFTNENSIVHMIRSYGVRYVDVSDLSYKGYSLPLTAPVEFFTNPLTDEVIIDPTGITLPLSLQKPLSVLNRNDSSNYRGFDTENYPLADPSDNQSVGQPFTKTVNTFEFGSTMVPNTTYSLVFNFDEATSGPYMTIVENSESLGDKVDDLIGTLILEPTDQSGTNYTLRFTEMNTDGRFYAGILGLQGVTSTKWDYDSQPDRANAVERIKLIINESGNDVPFAPLIDGNTYTFNQGVIYSQKFPKDFWDGSVDEYNINLVIEDETDEQNNYGARLEVTSNDPIANQGTIAKINTKFIDSDTNTNSLKVTPGKKFGDFQVTDSPEITTSEQKAGVAFFKRGDTVQRITFTQAFEPVEDETNIEYHVALTPDNNVRTWYANKDENGFFIYIEPNTQFEGNVAWTATRIVKTNVIAVPVTFEEPIPVSITADGQFSNYMVQLTPDSNAQIWYEDLTSNGFTIKSEIDYVGKVSWSVFNYFEDDSVPRESESGYRQRGTVVLRGEQLDSGVPVELEVPIPDENYAIQLIPNKNVNVFYNDKTPDGFTIRSELGVGEELVVDWYVDSTNGYNFQKHGEVDFRGRFTTASEIPGLRFVNLPETFSINGLKEGDVRFSFVNINSIIDTANNGLEIQVDPSRTAEDDIRFIINRKTISTNSVRVFLRSEDGTWEEWQRAGTGTNVNISPGEKVYRVRVNPDKLAMIEFGDGESWGVTPVNQEMYILGLDSVGSEGNINKNVLSEEVIVSKYILGNDKTDIEFESSFVSLLGLKKTQYFDGSMPETRIVDSEGTKLNTSDLSIIQNKNAFGGNDVETVDELRKNAVNYFMQQGRIVSLDDYKKFSEEVFSNYIIKVNALSYEDIKDSGLIPEEELAQYWYNHVFIVGLNKDGTNIISKSLRDLLIEQLDNASAKMVGKKHEVIAAKWVPVDILIRYKKSKFGNYETIETEIRRSISEFFKTENHDLGEKIHVSQIRGLNDIDNVDVIEVMINKNTDNFTASDYDVTALVEDDPEKVRRNKVMELVARDPSLIKILQPLFDTLNVEGERNWDFAQYVYMEQYEFPKVGEIVIEREV
jgi:hypothetical protein